MTKSRKKVIRYSSCFKLSIIQQIEEEGFSIEQVRKRYGIGGSNTIQNWLRQYGKNHLLNKKVRIETMEEQDELQRLRSENKSLKIAYAELSLHHKCSETVIRVADEMFDLDLKKKYAQELSKYSGKKQQ